MAQRRRRAKVDRVVPSGRLDAFIDMGNPMKGISLFPYLRRRTDGRALKAVAPGPALEMCRTVCEAARPARWPRDEVRVDCLSHPTSYVFVRYRACVS